MSQTETAAPAEPAIPKDPLVHKSYALPIALSMLAFVASLVLAVVDEMMWRRPYKAIQGQYQETYSAYLSKVAAKRREFHDNVLVKVADYEKLAQAAKDAEAAVAGRAADIEAQLKTATARGRALGEALKNMKSEIAALTYESEHKSQAAGHDDVAAAPEARPIIEEIEKIRGSEVTYTWNATTYADGQATTKEESATGKVGELLDVALGLESLKAKLQQDLGEATAPAGEAARARAEWLSDNLGNLKYTLENCDDATRKRIAESGAARYLDETAVSLAPDSIEGLKRAVDEIPHDWNIFRDGISQSLIRVSDVPLFRGDIQQIHIKEAANWVDRCTTCHLNAREPMAVTVDGLKSVLAQTVTIPGATAEEGPTTLDAWPQSKIDSMPLELFKSHPRPELLKAHDPERFGCSMCHNGNGVAITSTELAHGVNHHWLQPLYPKEHAEAGCVQCHTKDLVLPMGERINAGRDQFRRAGCWGCHKYEGFNKEVDEITALGGRWRDVQAAAKSKTLRADNLFELQSAVADDEAAMSRMKPAVTAERSTLTQEVAQLRTEQQQIQKRLRELHVERQRVGPTLKDVKVKLLREFLTDWVRDPRAAHKDAAGNAFRPDTKMPTFRWWGDADEEVKDVAAFLWQSALDPSEFPEYRLKKPAAGDAKRGRELFEQTGCLVCHSMGTGDAKIGSDYAANLSNLGEKDTPEYVARWIRHPRERLVAYDPAKKPGERDVTGAKKPEEGGDPDLVWSQHAIMPNFRLSDAEVADITAYLISQKRAGVKYEEPTWLDDEKRFENGKKLVLFQGCAGCHEIKGLEDEKGIGVELTPEGSKPIERLDFGHLTIAAERGEEPLKDGKGLLEDAASLFTKDQKWYRVRGFVLHKIAKPDIYDTAKYLPDRYGRLRMPQFKLTAQEIRDVTTMVIGSVETKIPETFRYRPDDRGKAIQEGWWVVKKYNCQGCHQIEASDVPSLWKVPFFAEKVDPKTRDTFLPPTLVGVGYRLRPEFMAKFLRDPSLGGDRTKPKSVRAHLPVRMPTFDFSDDEIQKLVLFFQAMADQPAVYQPRELKPLTETEKKAAAAIWKSANCIQCHVMNGSAMTTETKAPDLGFARERLRPEWMHRWISDPPGMNPSTAMTRFFGDHPGKDGRWHFMTELPELKGLDADDVDLMVRYVAEGLGGK